MVAILKKVARKSSRVAVLHCKEKEQNSMIIIT
jgi:hypothetical protein